MGRGKKILLGLVVSIIVLLTINQINYMNTDEYKESEAKYQDQLAKRAELDQAWDDAKKYLEENKAKNASPQPKSVSLSETQYENMVLNYKGTDGKGFSIKDFSDARCGDNQSSYAQYLGDSFDGKSNYHHVMVHSPVNIDWNPPCLGAGWHFGVNNQGDVIAWDYSAERQDILDYLDTQG